MKKVLLIIGLLLTVVLVNSYNYPSKGNGHRYPAYDCKTFSTVDEARKYVGKPCDEYLFY